MDESSLGGVFPEPERPPSPQATTSTILREKTNLSSESDWNSVEIRLVGTHVLWGHHLWNAALAVGTFLDENTQLYKGKAVLELGAGGGLPGIVAAKNGARKVILTDYPEDPLINNLNHNIARNFPDNSGSIEAHGYIWGQNTQPLIDAISTNDTKYTFDLIIMSDLIFNHSQHARLIDTCQAALSLNGTVLVFFSHHRPRLASLDLRFFEMAQKRRWTCKEIFTRRYKPMFPEDPGDSEVRATVHGWTLHRDTDSEE